jgi:hypothetical protein
MSNKLHELLAVEQDRKNKAAAALGETLQTFSKRDVLFDGMSKRYVAMEEDSEIIPDETKEMVTTLKEKLQQTLETFGIGIDAHLSKEETNASNTAKAELLVDGVSFGILSATSLLALETHLGKLRELYLAIPTLDLTKKWIYDAQRAVYRTEDEVKFRSIKRPKVIVKYEATKEHPAQTELLYLDYQVGKYETTYYSGKISANQKALLLRRLDMLVEAIKTARAKANNVDVQNTSIAKRLFDFINKDVV